MDALVAHVPPVAEQYNALPRYAVLNVIARRHTDGVLTTSVVPAIVVMTPVVPVVVAGVA